MGKVLVLNGSPKKKGTVATLLRAVVEGASPRHEIDWVNVYDLKMRPCIGCMRCRHGGECRLAEDDAHVLARKIKEADALVVGSPAYWGQMSAPLKTLFDRTVPVFIGDKPKGFPYPKLKGKKTIVVSACATGWPFNFISAESRGAVRSMWKGILKWAGYELVGKVVQPGTKEGSENKGLTPCASACPVHTPARDYVQLVREGDFAEAYRVASEPNPFPAVCGRICNHACETECTRGKVDEAVSIAGLKRFVADWAAENVAQPKAAEVKFAEKVAVVGAGPSGLSAARDLALLGYKVTVFDSKPAPGGMLRWGIPEYRLPRAALQQDIDRILALGVDLSCGQAAGVDFAVDGLLSDGYKAVYLATGLQGGKPLPIPGNDAKGVFTAVDLLREVALGRQIEIGKNVVVIGGGDVAFDAGRTALRLGAEKVTLACIEDDQTMPGSADEIEEGLGESVSFLCSCMPTGIVTGPDGRPSHLEFAACTLGDPDERGWRPPVPLDDSLGELACDTVIFATGQALVPDFLQGCSGVQVDRNQIVVERDTLMTGREGVFAGGDAASSGANNSTEAVAAGRRAARSIHNYLRRRQLLQVWEPERKIARPDDAVLAATPLQARLVQPRLDGAARSTSWDEVCGAYSEAEASAEAHRCLDCRTCADWGGPIPPKRLREAKALGAKL